MQPWPKRLSLSYPTPPFLSHSLDASATVITSGRGPNGHREMASPATHVHSRWFVSNRTYRLQVFCYHLHVATKPTFPPSIFLFFSPHVLSKKMSTV
jgi:hypothetical protein